MAFEIALDVAEQRSMELLEALLVEAAPKLAVVPPPDEHSPEVAQQLVGGVAAVRVVEVLLESQVMFEVVSV